MKVTWEVIDGYIGKSRPQYTEIPDEILDEIESEEEKQEYINLCIDEDFNQKITWAITGAGVII